MKPTILSKPYCPFSAYASPHENIVAEKIQQWIAAYDWLPESKRTKLQEIAVESMAALWYPHTGCTQLVSMSRFLLWGFVYDDAYTYSTPKELEQAMDRSVAILRGDPLHARDNIFHQQLFAFATEVVAAMPDHWRERFAIHVRDFLEGSLLEDPYVRNMRIPSRETYLMIREKTVGVEQMIDLIEAASGEILPAPVMQHPAIKHLRALVCRLITWSNDYYSIHKELGNDVMNIILIIENERQCSFDEARATVARMYNQEMDIFIADSEALPDFGLYNAMVNNYIRSLEYMLSGDLAWYQRTRRYQVQ